MKKIIAVVAVIIVAFLGYQGYHYYESTYVGTDTYAVVPEQVPEKKELKSDSGELIKEDGVQLYTYHYQLSGVTKDGKVREMSFEVDGVDPKPLQPNSVIKASVSEKRVVKGPWTIKNTEVPAEIQSKIGL